MRTLLHRTRSGVAAALAALALGGCDSFLTGPGLDNDPNLASPDLASARQLFVAVQSAQFTQFGGTTAYTICIWLQQCNARNNRFLEVQGRTYVVSNATFSPDFAALYTGGGLVDLRQIQARADAGGDQILQGIAQVWEAIVIGEAADKWGDLPYSEAVDSTVRTPVLDNQLDVYAALQTLLDQAIANLNSGNGAGPGSADLVYGGDPALWVRLANTLKARYLLHTVEANGNAQGAALAGNALYTQIAALAANGINSPAGDFSVVLSGANQNESNTWWQFNQSSFGADLFAGDRLVTTMNTRNDPRRTAYFGPTLPTVVGSNIEGTRNAPDFDQPWVTYIENLLIRAEAELLRPGGGVAAAQPVYNTYRTAAGLPAAALPGTIAGALTEIMTEKWIALFQNWESWNDYKRTCIPALVPTANQPAFYGRIPARLYYGDAEQNANPNIPTAATQISTRENRNRNDPLPCP